MPKVDLVTTDGFLLPNAVLEREGLMEKKGFTESYDLPALLLFLADVKAGRRPVCAPIYSHLVYDVMPDLSVEVDRPDILIVEGLNVLQDRALAEGRQGDSVRVDFFDFSAISMPTKSVLRQLVRQPLSHFCARLRSAIEVILPSLCQPRATTTPRPRRGARSGTGS